MMCNTNEVPAHFNLVTSLCLSVSQRQELFIAPHSSTKATQHQIKATLSLSLAERRCVRMEGVVLVEKLSGALVFTRSFADAFDRRHPHSERMNLSALLFALLNFTGTSHPTVATG